MLPKSLALIDDDKEYAEFLAQYLQEQGVRVDVFSDSNDLLVHADPYGYQFYLVDLMLPGIDGVDLIKLLRRRTTAGLVVVSGRLAPEVFKDVISAGADMYLTKPVQFEQVALAIKAVNRRISGNGQVQAEWRLERRTGQLVAPDGARVDLSDIDQALMECFVEAHGEVVSRDTLRQRIGKPDGKADDQEATDGLNATIYRLRRRIERATPLLVPLQSKSRVGYVFRAPLTAA
ncbi:MAG: response regulator transcription factor [Aquabacterium sp.]|uniref:response regulator transcription factor n=1 Tax=Aquabacterium sp. TaxID=1872578 RepID=UPI0011FD9A68|nr:response regulator transcription factor [Aquabacterium sp.]TAK88750.1 MAG: response regulator transcription factor [Aquabacterium sp.]